MFSKVYKFLEGIFVPVLYVIAAVYAIQLFVDLFLYLIGVSFNFTLQYSLAFILALTFIKLSLIFVFEIGMGDSREELLRKNTELYNQNLGMVKIITAIVSHYGGEVKIPTSEVILTNGIELIHFTDNETKEEIFRTQEERR